jgi:hypothetical protein
VRWVAARSSMQSVPWAHQSMVIMHIKAAKISNCDSLPFDAVTTPDPSRVTDNNIRGGGSVPAPISQFPSQPMTAHLDGCSTYNVPVE